MDRQIIYPGQVPLETDLLNTNRNTMTAIAKVAAALFGTAQTMVNGLAVTQTGVASMNVQVAPGEIYMLANLDTTAYSSLALDTTHQIVKQGISLDNVLLGCAAPGTGGFSINYLIQATFSETDGGAVVLPYYNASNTSSAYSGPANAGTTNNTKRQGIVTLSAKAGTAATTGTQTTPLPDAGYVGLAVVTVANGASSIVNANISVYTSAPVIPSAGLLIGGFQNNAFNSAQAAGTADALTAVFTPGITSLPVAATPGVLTVYVRAASANATATPTFTPNSGVIAAKTIVKGAGSALIPGDIAGGGHWCELQYDLTLDKWILLNPASGISNSKKLAQIVTFQTGAVATGITLMSGGAAAPTNIQGDQYMSLAITPVNAGSTLEIDVEWEGSNSTAGAMAVALFQDSTVNALAATRQNFAGGAGQPISVSFKHIMVAGTTSATTFKVRAGANVAGTTTFNGVGGSQEFGGVMASRITIKEYLP